VRIFVIGAGLVGARIAAALHADHDLTVVDIDAAMLKPLAQHYDVATAQASATSGRELLRAGIADANLVVACTNRDEANLVAGTFARNAAPGATTIVRTSSGEYVDIWRDGRLDVDCVVSSEVETARAVSAAIGMPAARQTDTFADGQVQIVELDVTAAASADLLRHELRAVRLPRDSRIAAIIRDRKALLVRGDAEIEPGDRVVVIGSPRAAQEWCQLVSPSRANVRDVVVFGAQELGAAIAQTLVEQGLSVRVVEANAARAALVAERLPGARVFNTSGLDREFLQREGIARVQAAIFAMRDDAKNLFAATLAHLEGVPYTIALAHDPVSAQVYEHAGVDITVDPLLVTAEEIVRFAHDPRTKQMAMLEGDRFMVLDLTTRPSSELIGRPLREMPMRGALIGAVVRDGRPIFPHGDDQLQAGDRVIVFTQAERAPRWSGPCEGAGAEPGRAAGPARDRRLGCAQPRRLPGQVPGPLRARSRDLRRRAFRAGMAVPGRRCAGQRLRARARAGDPRRRGGRRARGVPGHRRGVDAHRGLRRAAVRAVRRRAARPTGRCAVRGHVRLHDDGREHRHRRGRPAGVDQDLAPADDLARRHRGGHDRADRAPAAASRRAPAARVRDRGAGRRGPVGPHP